MVGKINILHQLRLELVGGVCLQPWVYKKVLGAGAPDYWLVWNPSPAKEQKLGFVSQAPGKNAVFTVVFSETHKTHGVVYMHEGEKKKSLFVRGHIPIPYKNV